MEKGQYLKTNTTKITAPLFASMKQRGEKIAMLTCYDYTSALLMDSSGVDAILVGDSASNTMAGYTTTLPITLDEMIYHTRSVVRAVQRAFVIADMPFGSVMGGTNYAVRSAVRMMKEAGPDALKIEGGEEVRDAVEAIIQCGIPVIGHLGLMPQSVHKLGGYTLQARDEKSATRLLREAVILEQIGCSGVVLEKIPSELAVRVTNRLTIPTIGIGAGKETDGQVLVMQDMLGITQGFKPKFLRHFASIGDVMLEAFNEYANSVKKGGFPSSEECY